MPIEYEALHTHFVVVAEDIAVGEVDQMLAQLPSGRRHDWYVIVPLAVPSRRVLPGEGGGFEKVEGPLTGYGVVLPVKELSDEAIGDREERSRLMLRDLPGLEPALTIERQTMGTGRARREWVPVSPKRRLVVLEEGQVVGLLKDEERAGALGGLMAGLPGQERKRYNVTKGRITYRCPVDGQVYDFAELIDLATNQLICPNGHIIEE